MLNAHIVVTDEFFGEHSPDEHLRQMTFTILDSLMTTDYDLFNNARSEDLLFMRVCSEFELMEIDHPHVFNDPKLLNVLINETVDIAQRLSQRYSHIVKIEYKKRTPDIFYLFTR